MPCDIKNVDIDVEVVEGAIKSDYCCVLHSSLLSLLSFIIFITIFLFLAVERNF